MNEHPDAVRAMLTSFYAASGYAYPQGSAEQTIVTAWCVALGEIPTDEIGPLTGDLLQHPPSHKGAIGVADVLARWNIRNGPPPGAANVAAYQPLRPTENQMHMLPSAEPEYDRHAAQLPDAGVLSYLNGNGMKGAEEARWTRKRFAAGLLAICCDCVLYTARNGYEYFHTAVLSHDRSAWICAQGRCRYSLPVGETMDAPSRGEVSPAFADAMDAPIISVPLSGVELLEMYCEFNTARVGILAAEDFAQHLLRVVADPEQWAPRLAREEWGPWIAAGGARFFEMAAL